jgi:protein-L-isoaspartate(D-aspartate) O-methyltransferase
MSSRYSEFKKKGLTEEQNGFYIARKRMVVEQLIPRGISDKRVLDVMSKIPRHLFVPPGFVDQAYSDRPLNIGEGQTISQPYMVALMTELLELSGKERVLEIGTGSGYQTERHKTLADRARKNLYRISITNFTIKVGDGTLGWREKAPFDRIIVTAGAPFIPPPYIEQLADGGKIVIPIGDDYSQQLVVAKKEGKKLIKTVGVGCRFVKLVGKHGWGCE